MVGAGACCHRPVKLPETSNQKLSPFCTLPLYLSITTLLHALADSHLSAAVFRRLSQSFDTFALTLSSSVSPFFI